MTSRRWTAAFAGYAALVAYGSLVPLNFRPLPLDEALDRFRQIQDLELGVGNRADWLANLFLYAPLGFMAALAGAAASRSYAAKACVAATLAFAAITLSFALEFAQLWFPPRTVSQNDLRAEVIGVATGVLLGVAWAIGAPAVNRFAAVRRCGGFMLAFWGYAALLLLYGAVPFDFVTSGRELQTKLMRPESVVWTPFADLEPGVTPLLKRCLQVASFAPLGWLAASRRRRVQAHRAESHVATAALLGLALSAAIELMQVFVYSRSSSTTAALIGGGGAALGGLGHSWVALPASRPAVVRWLVAAAGRSVFWVGATIASAAMATLVLLAPFQVIVDPDEVARRWSALFQPPFAAMYYGSEFQSVVNLLLKACVFLPLGICLRIACAGLPGRLSGFAPLAVGLSLGCAVELSQIYLGPHFPDVTDILIDGAATSFGWWLAERWLLSAMAQYRQGASLQALESAPNPSGRPWA